MAAAPEGSRVPISKRLVLINSISGMATRLLTVGVFAWVFQYLMKRIPEEELALFPIVMSLAAILPVLQIVLTGGLSRFVTEAYARHDMDGVTRIVSSQLPLLLVAAVLVLVFGGAVAWNIDDLLNIAPAYVGKARVMMLMIVGRIAFGFAVAPLNTGLYANQRFVLQNMIEIASSILRMILMIVFILAIGPRIEWVVAAQVISQVFQQTVSTVFSMRLLPALRFRPAMFEWATCRRILAFSGWNFVTESASLIRRAADAPLLNLFSTSVAVNDFFLGSLFETQLRQMAITATQPLMPALTAMHAFEQHGRLAAAYLRGSRIALWASLFLAVPLMIVGHDLFALYLGDMYPEHVDAANVMTILLLGFPLTYPTLVYARIAYARNDIRPLAIRAIVSQLGNLALTLLLVGTFDMGSIGSAIATLASFAVVEPFFDWPLALRSLKIPWRDFIAKSLWPGLVPGILASVAGVIAVQFAGESHVARIAIGTVACVAAYVLGMFAVLTPSDRADLARIRNSVGI